MSEAKFRQRNESALLWQGIIFFVGLAFIDGNAVVPVFISSMGGSLALAGLASAIHQVPSVLMQLLVGTQAGRIANLPRYITVMMAVFYSLPLVMAGVLVSGAAGGAALAAFLLLYGLLWAGDGCVLIGWYDLFGRLADPRRRGLILGRQQLFGGILAIGSSMIAGAVLSDAAMPLHTRYAVLFALAGLFLGGSSIAMAFVRDTPHRPVSRENPLKSIASFPKLIRQCPMFLRLTGVQALQGTASASLPLLILFSKGTFGLPMQATALLIPVQTAGMLTGGLVWGWISHRLCNRRVIQANQVNILLTMALAISALLSGSAWMAFPLAFLSGITFSCWIGVPNYLLDIAPEQHRPAFLAVSSLVNLPFTFLPPLAGRVAEGFGFLPVFIACAAAAAASLALSTRLRDTAQTAEFARK